MGCGFSCKIFSSSTSLEESSKMIRVIHLNGDIEYLEHPVRVAQVIGNPPRHLLFTHSQLLTNASTPLKLDTLLEVGKMYFMLPHTLFNATVSPTDLAPMVRKLVTAANSKCNKRNGKSPILDRNSNRVVGVQGDAKPSRRPWKPILSTIREISFTRRSESDLQKKEMVD